MHKRFHTGERSFLCDRLGCSAAFVASGALVAHKRTHTGERPFVCDHLGCSAAFSESGSLVNHKHTHTGERPFACDHPGCPASFTSASNRAKHYRSLHTPDGAARQKRQEQRVARALESSRIDFTREHTVDFKCIGNTAGSCARIDFLLQRHGHLVLLEVDEEQHRFGYDVGCDVARMAKVTESLMMGGFNLPTTFVRYNPHKYKVNDELVRVPKAQREARLISLLEDPRSPVYAGKLLAIMYLYYDCATDGTPDLLGSPEYSAHMACCVLVSNLRLTTGGAWNLDSQAIMTPAL